MKYIVFDLEFNQDLTDKEAPKYFFEIIQLGAVKLNAEFKSLSSFNRYIKPSIYKNISPFITELTGITADKLREEKSFQDVFKDFIEFIGEGDTVFCIWGMSDIKELFRSTEFFGLDRQLLPRMFINLQLHVSRFLGLSARRLPRLEGTVEAMNIPKTYAFHDALNDAFYTAEILKKLNYVPFEPKFYDPAYVIARPPRHRKREIDYDRLLQQFEKMYARPMTEEEKGMILLAYKMGKTSQFQK